MVALGPGFPFSDLSTPSVRLPRLRRIGHGLGCDGERPTSEGGSGLLLNWRGT